jgi:hypothetical protein
VCSPLVDFGDVLAPASPLTRRGTPSVAILNFRSVSITHLQLSLLSIAPQPSIVATLPITTRTPGVLFQPFFDYRHRKNPFQKSTGQCTPKSAPSLPSTRGCAVYARPSREFTPINPKRSGTDDAIAISRDGTGIIHSSLLVFLLFLFVVRVTTEREQRARLRAAFSPVWSMA